MYKNFRKQYLENYVYQLKQKFEANNKEYTIFHSIKDANISDNISGNLIIIGDDIADDYPTQNLIVNGDVYIIGNGTEADFLKITGDLYIVNLLGQEVDIEEKKTIQSYDNYALNQLYFENIQGNVYVVGLNDQGKYYGSALQGHIKNCHGNIFIQNGSVNKANLNANIIYVTDFSKNLAVLNTPVIFFQNYSTNYNHLRTLFTSIDTYSTNYGDIDSSVFLVNNQSTNLGDVIVNEIQIGHIIINETNYSPGLFALKNNSLNKGAVQVGSFELDNSKNVGFVANVGNMILKNYSENHGEIFISEKVTLIDSTNKGDVATFSFLTNGNSENYGTISATETISLEGLTKNLGNIGAPKIQLSDTALNHGDIFSNIFTMLQHARNVGSVFTDQFSLSTTCDNKGYNYAQSFILDNKLTNAFATHYNVKLIK